MSEEVRRYQEEPLKLTREEPLGAYPNGLPLYSHTLRTPGPDPLRVEEREWVRRKYVEEAGSGVMSDSGYVLWLEERVNYLYGYIVEALKEHTQSLGEEG